MTYELFTIHHPEAEMPKITTGERPIGKQRHHVSGGDRPLLQRAELFAGQNEARYGAEAGRLRHFFMLHLKTILHTDWRSQQRANLRGSVRSVADVSAVEHELRDDLQNLQQDSLPEEIFHRTWRRTLIRRARKAVKESMAAAGDLTRFQVLWPLVDQDSAVPATTDQAAAKLGISQEGVRTAVHRLRKEFREQILKQIADTVASDDREVIEEEVRALFASPIARS